MRRTMHRTLSIPAFIAAVGFGSPLAAQEAQPQPCSAAEHRHFDFWVGEWEVVDSAGSLAGRNRITREMNGCVLREEWTSAGGGTGSSFNIYDAAAGRWHQTWVDASGTLLMLDGGLESAGVMVMEGERPANGGGIARHRITWTREGSDRVRQRWDATEDGGATWNVVFDGLYRRVTPQSAAAAQSAQSASTQSAQSATATQSATTAPADPADVADPQSLVNALYQIMARRPGERFDWQKMRPLFLPSARLIPNTEQTGGEFRVLTVDEFTDWIDRVSVIGGPDDHGFQEEEIATRIEQFGDIAHAFSTYQKHFHGSDDILGRGINSIQMVRMNDRWWVSQIVWDEESGAGPIPERYRRSSR